VEKILSAKPFVCPNCGKELPLADVNVAQDLALCRACNYRGAFLAAATVAR
jgi:DNA-directed RNA polymerase subunit RPC12/RpoP